MITHLTDGERPAIITCLIVTSALLACLAAHEVRRDDVLGWTLAVGHAVLTVTTVAVLLTVGLPGLRISGWTFSTISTIAMAGVMLITGVQAGHRRSTARRAEVSNPLRRVG